MPTVLKPIKFLSYRRFAYAERLFADQAAAAVKRTSKDARIFKESSSFVMNMFLGKAVIRDAFPYPLSLNDERKEVLQILSQSTEKFLSNVNNPAKNDEESEIPAEVLSRFAELGSFGALVPEEYGGAGLNNTQVARIAEIVGANDLALGVVLGAHQSIGYKGILLYGTEMQKRKYLPDLAAARKYAAFCLTEPAAGSDANSIRTRAVKSSDGKHYILSGSKLWISNGSFAEIFTVFAQTAVQDTDGNLKNRMSAFIVERSFGGVKNGLPEKKMGIKGSSTVEVTFENTNVPVENLLGVEGEGFKLAMNILNNGRFGIPAVCTGAMKFCIQKSIDHVCDRSQFGRKLKEFGNVHEYISDMVCRHYAAESLTYLLSSNMDKGIQDFQLEAAIGKVMASENAWITCDQAIQLHGGMGYMKDCGLERVLRDLRIFRIFEGANDVLRLFIALTGIQYAGKYFEELFVKNPSYISRAANYARHTILPKRLGVDLTVHVHPSLKDSAELLNNLVVDFGTAVQNFIMKYKRGLTDRQYELIRIANATIDIYSMVAVLARCTRASCSPNSEDCRHEQNIANLFCIQASKRVERNLAEIYLSETESNLLASISNDLFQTRSLKQAHPVEI